MKSLALGKTIVTSTTRECCCSKTSDLAARRIIITGRVQGLGVRPTIYRLATKLDLVGFVRNSHEGVEVEVEGPSTKVSQFLESLYTDLPPGTRIERFHVREIPVRGGQNEFEIVVEPSGGPLTARVPEDLAACHDCLEEVRIRSNRRYRSPTAHAMVW